MRGEDPRRHWFIYERMWDVAYVTDDDKNIAQFVGALRKRALTWYMNFTENQTNSKDDIKVNFLAFFKTEDVAHLATKSLNILSKYQANQFGSMTKDSKISWVKSHQTLMQIF